MFEGLKIVVVMVVVGVGWCWRLLVVVVVVDAVSCVGVNLPPFFPFSVRFDSRHGLDSTSHIIYA